MEVQEIMNIDVLRCLVPLTSDAGLPIAKSMWGIMPNNLAVFELSEALQVPSSPPHNTIYRNCYNFFLNPTGALLVQSFLQCEALYDGWCHYLSLFELSS